MSGSARTAFPRSSTICTFSTACGATLEPLPSEAVPPLSFYGARKHTRFDPFELYKYVNRSRSSGGSGPLSGPTGMSNPDFAVWLEETARPILSGCSRAGAGVPTGGQVGVTSPAARKGTTS